MGRRGPPKTATAVLKKRDSRRAKARKDEPVPDLAVPRMPSLLPAAAKAEWKRVVPVLVALRIISTLDRGVLTAYCLAWSEMCDAVKAIAKDGYMIETDKGNLIQHPMVGVLHQAEGNLNRFAGALGLSPAARANVKQIPEGLAPGGKRRFFDN